MQYIQRFWPALVLLSSACVARSADTAGSPSDAVTTAPAATRPAESVVLVRFGDAATLTQAEFNRNARGYGPDRYDNVMSSLTRDKLFLLHIQDNPELVPSKDLEDAIDTAVIENKAKTREELEQKLQQRGLSWDDMQERLLIGKAMNSMVKRGESHAHDQKYMRKRFDDNPPEFDGTSVSARHIQKTVFPYNTPADRERKRAELARIRQDIVSGKLKWDDAVKKSDCRSKLSGGNLGSFTRHIMITEPVAEAAFKLNVGDLSEIVESDLGFHIIEVLGRQPGTGTFENEQTQKEMRIWLEYEPLQIAMRETRKKYPVVGVEPPSAPPPMAKLAATTAPAATQSTKPAHRSKMRDRKSVV